jgi:hypothetical protein
MFITEEESRKRLESKRNILGPNYERPKRRPLEIEEALPEDCTREERADISAERVQAILNDTNGIRNRQGNLTGMTDVQIAIGTTSAILGEKSAGSLYRLSREQSKAYELGESSKLDIDRGITRNPSRRQAMESIKDSLAERAASRLGVALDSLTSEKINQEKHAGNIARIAKDMAVVVDKVTKDNGQPEHVHFHIFRPEMRTVRDYQTVQVHAASTPSGNSNESTKSEL